MTEFTRKKLGPIALVSTVSVMLGAVLLLSLGSRRIEPVNRGLQVFFAVDRSGSYGLAKATGERLTDASVRFNQVKSAFIATMDSVEFASGDAIAGICYFSDESRDAIKVYATQDPLFPARGVFQFQLSGIKLRQGRGYQTTYINAIKRAEDQLDAYAGDIKPEQFLLVLLTDEFGSEKGSRDLDPSRETRFPILVVIAPAQNGAPFLMKPNVVLRQAAGKPYNDIASYIQATRDLHSAKNSKDRLHLDFVKLIFGLLLIAVLWAATREVLSHRFRARLSWLFVVMDELTWALYDPGKRALEVRATTAMPDGTEDTSHYRIDRRGGDGRPVEQAGLVESVEARDSFRTAILRLCRDLEAGDYMVRIAKPGGKDLARPFEVLQQETRLLEAIHLAEQNRIKLSASFALPVGADAEGRYSIGKRGRVAEVVGDAIASVSSTVGSGTVHVHLKRELVPGEYTLRLYRGEGQSLSVDFAVLARSEDRYAVEVRGGAQPKRVALEVQFRPVAGDEAGAVLEAKVDEQHFSIKVRGGKAQLLMPPEGDLTSTRTFALADVVDRPLIVRIGGAGKYTLIVRSSS